MKITKLGHCCLVIEDRGVRVLTDPGAWTQTQNEQRDIDIVLITHEHNDHFHIESLKIVLHNNPAAIVITNSGVGKRLEAEGIACRLVADGQTHDQGNLKISGFGQDHAPIYPGFPTVINTSYFIGEGFFYPGDALYIPPRPVELLALPVCGPWLKIAEAIDYAKAVKPQQAFPVHDGMLKIFGPFHALPQRELAAANIVFTPLVAGDTLEL